MPESGIRFRRAASADLPAIVDLLADDDIGATREVPGTPLDGRYLSAFGAIDKDPNQFLVVAEQERDIVGCLQLTFIPGLSRTGMWRGQIESVRSARSVRGEGLGHGLEHLGTGRASPFRRVMSGRFGGPDTNTCTSCHWRGGPAGGGSLQDAAFLYGDGARASTADAPAAKLVLLVLGGGGPELW